MLFTSFRPFGHRMNPTFLLSIVPLEERLRIRAAEIGNDLLSVDVKCPPMGFITLLTAEAHGFGLPRLIEGFEKEHVVVPVKSSTHAVLVECLCILGSGNGGARVTFIMIIGSALIGVSVVVRNL